MAVLRQEIGARECWNEADNFAPEGGLLSEPLSVRTGGAEQRLALIRTIEGEIIPRLMLAHCASATDNAFKPPPAVPKPESHVEKLSSLVLATDDKAAFAYVDELLAQGVNLQTIYLALLAPTARHLGDLWAADVRDFAEVTLGLCRLQQMLHRLSAAFHSEFVAPEQCRRALLAATPGEQHGFGLLMVTEFFRRAGWDVWTEPCPSSEDLVKTVRTEWFDIVGFSVSCESRLDRLAAAIRAVRRAAKNRDIGVMVGGRVFIEHPELVAKVGADATAADGLQATEKAAELVAESARRRS